MKKSPETLYREYRLVREAREPRPPEMRHSTPLPRFQEAWLEFVRLFTSRGRELNTVKKHVRDQLQKGVLKLWQMEREESEHRQREHIKEWQEEYRRSIHADLMNDMASIYPDVTPERMEEEILRWSRRTRVESRDPLPRGEAREGSEDG